MMQRLGSAEQSKGGKAAAKVAQGLMDEEVGTWPLFQGRAVCGMIS